MLMSMLALSAVAAFVGIEPCIIKSACLVSPDSPRQAFYNLWLEFALRGIPGSVRKRRPQN